MKKNLPLLSVWLLRAPARAGRLLQLAGALALALVPGSALAQVDDFNDSNDNGWTHYDPLGGLGAGPRAAYNVSSGAYRIQALTSPSPAAAGPGRAASLRQDISYSRFHVTVDVVGWDDTLNQAFGILTRIGSPVLGQTVGYAFTYQVRGHDVQISKITGEDPSDVSPVVSVTLNPTNRYRFVFSGDGGALQGSVYLASNLTTPLAAVMANDFTYASGTAGLVVFDNSSGGTGTANATFDNYYADTAPAPSLSIIPLIPGEVLLNWPVEPAGYELQCTTSFTPPRMWTSISTNDIVDVGGLYQYYDGSGQTQKFFRLKK